MGIDIPMMDALNTTEQDLDALWKLAANMQWKGKEPKTVELGDLLKQLIKDYKSACTSADSYANIILNAGLELDGENNEQGEEDE